MPRKSCAYMPKRQKTSMHGGFLLAVDSKEVAAAVRLQRVWRSTFRHLTTRAFAVRFLNPEFGIPINKVKNMSFQALVIFLREQLTVDIAKNCLQRIHLLSTFRHGSPCSAMTPENVNVRVFLAAFMMAFRPTHTFESMGVLERTVFNAALLMVNSFQRIVERVVCTGSFQGVPAELTEGLPEMLFDYFKCFKAWKVPDEAKLVCRIKHALVALHQAEGHLPLDEPADSQLKMEFRTQIARLRHKLVQIGGAAELAKFDASGVSAASIAGGREACAYTTLPGRMTNEQLAHELLLDSSFKLDDTGSTSCNESPVYHRIRSAFHQAFWDSLVDDLSLRLPCYVRVLRVLAEIRDTIIDLGQERAVICEIIDMDLIESQAELGVFDWAACRQLVGSVVGIIQRIQAPSRDAETREKWMQVGASMLAAEHADRPRVMCTALEFLLDRLCVMRIDAANARLRLIAPVIRMHGVEYERGKFQEKLDDGTLTLERTQALIVSSVRRGMVAGTIVLGDLIAGKARAFVAVHTLAMFNVIASPFVVTSATVPETLLFDVSRLLAIQRDFCRVVDGATMLLTAAQAVSGSGDRARAGGVLVDLAGMIVAGDLDFDGITDLFCSKLDSAQLLTAPVARAKLLSTLSAAIGNTNDAVRGLVALRIGTAWVDYMNTAAPIAGTKFLPALRPLIPLIEVPAGKLTALINMNRTVYLPIYNRLIAEAAAAVVV